MESALARDPACVMAIFQKCPQRVLEAQDYERESPTLLALPRHVCMSWG